MIQLSVLAALGMAAFFLAGAVGGGAGTVAVIIVLILTLVVIVGYPLAMESLWSGRTLGMAALGLRVVTVEGGPVRVRQSATRAIIGVFELWMTFGSVAVLVTILTPDNQRLGDLVGGTLVLRERSATSTGATAMSFPAPYGYADYVASIDVSVLTSDQYGVIRTFLMRVLDLTQESRGALAVKLANATALELRHTPPSNLPPELFLVCVASAYQARHGAAVTPTGWGGAPSPVYGQQPGYGLQPGYGQQAMYGQPPPPTAAPVAPWAPPPTGPPVSPWAPPPGGALAPSLHVDSPHPPPGPPPGPPRFTSPPTGPPRFDVPPVDAPSFAPDGPVESAEPVAAPWPPRKPGPPGTVPPVDPGSVGPGSVGSVPPVSPAPVASSTPAASWPPRKPGPPGTVPPVASEPPAPTTAADPSPMPEATWPPRKPGPPPTPAAEPQPPNDPTNDPPDPPDA